MLNKSRPGRPPTWDEAQLLTALIGIFRKKGFGHVSVRDIEEATKLHPGSLYKAYGSKRGLFLAALREYNDRVVHGRVRRYLDEAEDPLEGIRALFASTFEGAEAKGPGCLLTNTAVETRVLTPRVRAEVGRGLTALEEGFARTIERAKRRGLAPRAVDVAREAARLLALYQGVLVLVRYGADPAKLTAITDGALAPLKHHEPRGDRR